VSGQRMALATESSVEPLSTNTNGPSSDPAMMFDERVEEVSNIPSHHHECNVIRSENELPGPVHMPQVLRPRVR
jgi:hypothetical protein